MKGSKIAKAVLARIYRKTTAIEKMGTRALCGIKSRIASQRGQGTTEYAILVGVLVVVAILAITIFKPKIEELWNAITTGIQGL